MSRTAAALVLVLAAAPLAAASAQGGARVRLEYRPHPGDTLHLELDQQTVLTGRRFSGGRAVSTARTTSTLRVYSRVIVESADSTGATLRTITDSVSVATNDRHARALSGQIQRAIAADTARLRISPDGAVHALGASVARGPGGALPGMASALLPERPVHVGDRWHGTIPIPPLGPLGPAVAGVLQNTYRFDSLARAGRMAWISLRGTLAHPTGAGTPGDSATGSVHGVLELDRRRGWFADSRLVILLRTRVPPHAGGATAPMEFEMRITQHLHAMDKRQSGG